MSLSLKLLALLLAVLLKNESEIIYTLFCYPYKTQGIGYYEPENTIFISSITFVNILLDINHIVSGCIVTIWFTMLSIFITLFKTDM